MSEAFNIYYQDNTYVLPAVGGIMEAKVVERPNREMIVETDVNEVDLPARRRWWGSHYSHGLFNAYRSGSREDIAAQLS